MTAIVVAAGRSSRMGLGVNKPYLPLMGVPVIAHTLAAFEGAGSVSSVVVVAAPSDMARCRSVLDSFGPFPKVMAVVCGGETRQESVWRGLAAACPEHRYVMVHDAARPLVQVDDIERVARVVMAGDGVEAAILAVPLRETLKRAADSTVVQTVEREGMWAAQTPQAFTAELLKRAHEKAMAAGASATDDSALVEALGFKVAIVEGSATNIKLTTKGDMELASAMLAWRTWPDGGEDAALGKARVGFGYDTHRLTQGRKLILGGVTFEYHLGLDGHSDADVLCHAIADAVLGAAALGDIGQHFPPSDESIKGISSLEILRRVRHLTFEAGYLPVNVDATLICERPKVMPSSQAMRSNIAEALQILPDQVSIKATTNEGMDATGRGEGISAHAVALLTRVR